MPKDFPPLTAAQRKRVERETRRMKRSYWWDPVHNIPCVTQVRKLNGRVKVIVQKVYVSTS
jgi:hypothetical protein